MEGALMDTMVKPSMWRRALDALDERLGIRGLRYPVPEHANKLAYSLGGLTLAIFLMLFVTGVVLTQYYDPTAEGAHASVRSLITDISFGSFLRAFHYWAAMAMVVLIALHLLRVLLTGAFKRPREGNWIIGVALLTITGAFFFTGTVLKWDQEALEALEHNVEVAKLLGRLGFWLSPAFGGLALIHRLYTLHVTILPALFFFVVAAHMMLVKYHGMARSPFRGGPDPEPTEPFTRHLARLGGFSLIIFAVLAALAVLNPPGHGPAPVEGIEVTKPPWPLLWFVPIENWIGISGILWATIVFITALLIVPFIDRSAEIDPRKRLLVIVGGAVVLSIVIGLIIYGAVIPIGRHIGG